MELAFKHSLREDVVEILDDLGDVLHAAGDTEGARQRALGVAEGLSNPDVDHIEAKLRGS